MAITLGTADIFAKNDATTKPRQFFLDLSANSVGLLTNTATGDWRKDLSLLTESWGRHRRVPVNGDYTELHIFASFACPKAQNTTKMNTRMKSNTF